jgi:glycogen debranching enzyme
MRNKNARVEEAKKAAVEVLLHNSRGPHDSLPRTAGWGYPEPYTRDLLISSLGFLVSRNKRLIKSLERVLETLARNQSRLGHIPSLVHDPEDRGSSDATPLFILAAGFYRRATGNPDFLSAAVRRAMRWMEYQSPSDRVLVAQLPTSDWRDEQWVLGFGLYVNALVYSYLRLYGRHKRASALEDLVDRFTVRGERMQWHVHEGLMMPDKPYLAAWSYKIYNNERFDLLGNSLAILSGLVPADRAAQMVDWIEEECRGLKEQGLLGGDLPPNFFPYIRPDDPDWRPRYGKFNRPGEYHNGGIWPFVCGFYIAALVAVGRHELAEAKLLALSELVRASREADVAFGFNEWHAAQDGTPRGQDWQTWSAALYLYAAAAVEQGSTPFFDEVRSGR